MFIVYLQISKYIDYIVYPILPTWAYKVTNASQDHDKRKLWASPRQYLEPPFLTCYRHRINPLPETNSKRTWKWMVRILVSFWDGPFSAPLAVSFRKGTDFVCFFGKAAVVSPLDRRKYSNGNWRFESCWELREADGFKKLRPSVRWHAGLTCPPPKILIALRKSELLVESLDHIEIFELSRTLEKSQPNHCIKSLFQIRIIPCSLFQTITHRIHVWYTYPHLQQKSTIHVGKYSTIASPMTQLIPTELPGKVKVKVNMLTPRTCGPAIPFPSCVLEIGRWYHFPWRIHGTGVYYHGCVMALISGFHMFSLFLWKIKNQLETWILKRYSQIHMIEKQNPKDIDGLFSKLLFGGQVLDFSANLVNWCYTVDGRNPLSVNR